MHFNQDQEIPDPKDLRSLGYKNEYKSLFVIQGQETMNHDQSRAIKGLLYRTGLTQHKRALTLQSCKDITGVYKSISDLTWSSC